MYQSAHFLISSTTAGWRCSRYPHTSGNRNCRIHCRHSRFPSSLFRNPLDHVDGFFAVLVIEVRSGEMLPGPFEIGIFVAAARESGISSSLRFRMILSLFPGDCTDSLHKQGSVPFHPRRLYGSGRRRHRRRSLPHARLRSRLSISLFLVPYFAYCPFLVEFTQIIEIIDAVACVIRPCRFVGRRSPDSRDASIPSDAWHPPS